MKQATLRDLAQLVEGELVGDGDLVLQGAAPIGDAGAGQITLVDSVEMVPRLRKSSAMAVLGPRTLPDGLLPMIRVEPVHPAFAKIVAHFRPPRQPRRIGISPQAVVSPTARIAEDVDIHPLATVGDDVEIGRGTTIHSGVHLMAGSKIGEEVTIYPGAVLYENTIVAARCIIHAGAVLGAYGFGYDSNDGVHRLSPQLGYVELGSDVEIGANTTIDRGTYGPTTIGEGTKIDNQVMVAHNCSIGRHNLLCAQVGIAGSSVTGDHVIMAGQVGVRDHVHVGSGAILGGMAGIMNDVAEGARMVGIPATPEREQLHKQAALAKLPEMRKQLKKLEAVVANMVANANGHADDQRVRLRSVVPNSP